MPGITGIIGPDVSFAQSAERARWVTGMVDVMRHESFYIVGTLHEHLARCEPWLATGAINATTATDGATPRTDSLMRAGIAAGWVVHEDAFSDCNPVWNESRDVCLIFTGEEFSDRSVVASLRARGHRFNDGDASYLVHLYEERGAAFIDDLNGTFSGLLIDLRCDLAILFNDRFGLGRVYVHESGDAGAQGVSFSSEAKCLLQAVPATRQIDATALAEIAACGCALQGRTLFKGVSLLPPASRWTFAHGRLLMKESYFHPSRWEQLPALSEAAYQERLSALFPQVVHKYFRGRLPMGMSLTGGLDGRMIMACSGQERGALPCYTFGGSYRDCADVSLARRVAQHCGQAHQVIAVDDGFISQFAPLAEKAVYVSDGAMDVTGSVELFANAQARQIAPVRMTGNYGSEILRNNIAFKAQPLSARLFNTDFLQAGQVASQTYAHEMSGRQLSAIAMKQVPWHHAARLSVEQSQLTMRSPYLDNEVVRLAYQAPSGQETSKGAALRFVADHHSALAGIPTDRGLLHSPTPVWTPLRRTLQELAARAEYAFDSGMPQWLAPIDRAFKPLQPERLFLGWQKFYHFRVWYRDKLASTMRDVLLDPRAATRPHVAPGGLKRLLDEHTSGQRNHTAALHQALSIELIHRQFIERAW